MIWKQDNAQNVVMFHIGRSGSTVLGDLLGQHPAIFWDAEIYARLFYEWEQQGAVIGANGFALDPVNFLQQRMIQAGERIYGFEIKFFHLKVTHVALPSYVTALHGLGFSHYVLLQRRNTLRKLVSSVIGHQRARWHQPADRGTSLIRISLDVNNVAIDRERKPLLAYLQDYETNFKALAQLLHDRHVLHLSYEEDVSADPQIAYGCVCDFLGLERYPAIIRYGKTNPFPLRAMIANFDEVEGVLSGTPYAWMLYE
jgi:hypothetical protein